MASFPDLRPGSRSAKAGSKAVRTWRSSTLLAVSAALLLTAFFAVSELATLRGAKAHDASAYLTRELGSPLSSAPLVRVPARGTKVTLSAAGFRVADGRRALSLRLAGLESGKLASYRHGVAARTSFGRIVVSTTPKKTEQFLVVEDHHGTKRWRWRIDAEGLRPRVGDDGYVAFLSGHRITDDFVIAPPKVLDAGGHVISPHALSWSIKRFDRKWWLELTVDDSDIPTPYIIDPASFNVGTGTTGPTAAGASLQVSIPTGVKVNDLLIAHVGWLGGSNITASPPAGGTWTQLDQTRNQSTTVGAQVWYRIATSADTSGGSYTWGFSPNAIGTGGIAAYSGIDLSGTPQVTQLITAPIADTTIYYPSITPSADNAQVISVVAHAKTSNGTRLTPPLAANGAAVGGTNTDRWETANAGGIASELSDFTQGTAAAVATNGSNTYGGNSGKSIAHVAFRIALPGDTTAPASALSVSSVSPAGSAYYPGSGTTVWFRGTGPNCAAETQVAAKCSFKITNTETDSGSGPASSQFGTLGGTSTGWTFTGSTVTTPTGGPYGSNFFAFSSGTSSSPTEQVTSADNGANSGNQTLTFTNDVTGPTVPTPTVTAGYYTSLSVGVSLGSVTDNGGGSGMNASSITVQRDAIGLSNGSCGVFTGSWSTVTLTGGNDTSVTSGNCYRYRETASDNVGNSTTSGISNTAKVDTTAPSTPTLSFGNISSNAYYDGSGTLWIRPAAGGTFTVTAASNDSESAVASYTFGTLNSNGGANFGGTQTGDHFDYTFGATTTAPTTARTVSATNSAGTASSNATYTISSDTTGPAVPTPTVTAGYYTSLSVGVSLGTVTDTGGSGPKASTFTVERDSIGLSNGACGTFTGSWSTVTLTGGNDTNVTSGNCYRYRETAADNVGNSTNSGAGNTAKVDTSAPSTPSLALSGLSANAYWNGSGTLYIRPSAGGTFTVTASSSDAQSGIGGYTFGTLNSNGGANFGGSLGGDHFDYTFGGSTTAPSTARTVSATNGAGTSSADATYSITADTTAPSVTAPSVTAGYYTTLSVPVSKNGGSDGGSGVDNTTSSLERDDATLTDGTCGGFSGNWTTVTLTGGNDTGVLNGHCYEYREKLSDHVGNQGTSGTSNVAKVDSQGPANSINLSNVSPAGTALEVGTRIYYRGSVTGGGSFKLTNAVTDGESGPASSATAALGGTTSGWSHTPSTVSTPAGGPYDSNSFSWSQGTSSSPTEVVSAADGAGNTTAASTLTFTNDSSAPTGGALTVNGGAAYSTSGSFGIDTRVDYTETQSASESGLASSTLTRAAASLTNDSCGTYGAPTTIIGTPAQTLSTGCYLYTLTGTDNVGNATSVTATVKVDTSDPSAPTFNFSNFTGTTTAVGDNVLFLPTSSGSFDVTAGSSDGDSGIAGYTFPSAASFGAGWSVSGSGSARTYSYTAGSATPGSQSVAATNNAGRTNSAAFDIEVSDTTPPTTSIQCNGAACQGSYYTSSPVSVTLSGDDGPTGSGVDVIRYTTDGTDPTPVNGSDYLGAFDIFTTTAVKFRAYDNLGNEEAVGSQLIRVDGTPPTVSLALAEQPAGGAQHVSGTTLYYRPGASGGTFRVAATADDPQTGVASVDFPSIANVTGGGSQTTSPYREDYSWGSTTSDSGSYDVVATNGAGATTSLGFTLTPDSTAPSGHSITLTGAGAPYYGLPSITFSLGNGGDGGSGLDASSATVTRETGTLSGNSCSGFTADAGAFASPDASVSGGHCYRYTFTIADNVGNVSTGVTATAKVDTQPPSISVNAPTALSGAAAQSYDAGSKTLFFRSTATGSFRLDSTSSDAHTAVTGVAYPDLSAVGGWSTSGTDSTWSSGASSPGARSITATDSAGNTAGDTITITDDLAAPTGQAITLTGPHAPYSNSASVNFSLTDGGDGPGSGIDTSSRTVTRETGDLSGGVCSNFTPDGGTFSSPDTSVGGGHCYRYTFTIADRVGNVSAAVSATARVDTDNPSVSLADPGTPLAGTVPLSANASDSSTAVDHVTFERAPHGTSTWTTIGTDSSAPYTAAWNTGALADGLYDLRAVATDTVGNTGGDAVGSRLVDNTAPDTSLDSGPPDPSNDATPTFTFSSTETGSTFECRVDGGGWAPCTSPHTTAALAEGSHTFQVRATDVAGNSDATPASSTWTIDLTGPDTTIDSGPSNPSGNATPTFTFSSSETGSTFECRVDAGSWAACTSPHTTAALDDGNHTFDVRATDAAGNTDGTPASRTWSIDLGPPSVTITAPTTYVNASDPSTYTVTASTPDGDVTHVDFYECSNASVGCSSGTWTQFDSDSSAPYSGNWATPGADGARAIRAIAVDSALNTGADVRTITIDRTAPSGVTISYPNGHVSGSFAITTNSGPDADVNSSTATLERQTGNLADDTCSSYSGWTAASSPDSVASGHCAVYRFRVADDAGNWSTATSGNEVKSDTNAPTSAQDDPGANLRQTVTLTSSASDTGGSGLASVAFERRPAGGGSWTTIATDTTVPYSASFDTTGVTDGLYDFRTVATDVAGNAEASPSVVANRRIDNTAPSATMQSPGNPMRGTVSLGSNTSDGGSGLATVTYELAPHGGSFNTQPASWDTTLGADGLYDLRVVATDVAGNSTTSPLVTTRVDNTPPALTFSSPASGDTVSGTVSLTATASDASPASPPISFFYKLHSDPPSAYTATGASWSTTSLPAGDGLYDLRARATDDVSNTTTVENTSIRVDNVPPSVAITAPAAAINGSLPTPTSFSATAGDPDGSGVQQVQFFECSNQSTDCASGVWSPLGTVPAPGPYTVSWNIPATDGNHALAAVATDNAGHASSDIRNVDVDRTAPETTIVGKPADPSNAATPSFTFGSSETGSTFECRIDGGSWAPCTSPDSVSGLTDSAHTFDVRATDAAGNTDPSPDTWTWHRDTTNPTGTLNGPGANLRQTVTVTSAESDPLSNGYASGLASVTYEYSSDGSTWATIGTLSSGPYDSLLWNTTGVADGVYQLRVAVNDVAGNSATSAAVTNVRIDNTVPTTSQDDPGQYLRSTKTLTGSAADSGSGVDDVDFQRAPAGSGSWTTIGTDSTPGDGFQASFDTTSVPDGHYDFRTVAYDVAGNQAASTPVTGKLIDNTPPAATLNDPGAYLRGAVSLGSSTSDPGGANASGVATVAYEYSANGGSTWLPTGSTFDSTSVADGNVDLHVVATDAAGNTTTSPTVTKLLDNTKPNTMDGAPGGWHASPVTVHLTANDAGSGANVTEYSVDGNPTYTVGTDVVIPAPADGSNDGSHTIAYFSVDNAGNIETVKSATVLIDATPPACPSCSAADYLRGTVTLGASPAADGSGIKSVAVEYTVAGGSTWTPIGTDTTAPYTADWDTTAVPDGHYDLRIVITDNADNVTTSDLPDKVVDNTSPNVATVGAPTEGQVVTGSVAISATASDATSPIASVEFVVHGTSLGTDTTAPFSLNWNTASGSDGAATIQIVVTDMAGNTTTSPLRNVTVDNLTPTPTLADPGQNLSGTVALSASSDPDTTQVDFERRPAGGGSWVTIASDSSLPWGTSLDTTTLADGLYDFRAVATDGTGHTGTSPVRSNIRVDNTAPSGSLTAPAAGATVGGTNVTLSSSVADGGSGVASVAYELRPTGGGAFSQIASSSGAPFSATWDATTVSTGSYDLRPVITDRAGNTFTGAVVTFNVDVTAPTVTLTSPGAMIFGTVTLNATVSGSGATNVVFAATPAGGATWTSLGTDTAAPWSVAYDTTKLPDGVYDLRVTVTDNLGNSSQNVVSGVRIDNMAPQVVSSSPADGSSVGSATAISLVASEPATPVGVTLDGGATVAPVMSGTHIDYNTGAFAAGPHTLAGELQDPSGKRLPFRVHFTIGSTGYVEKNTSSSSSTTVTSGDGFGSATMPAGAWSTSSNDWLVVRIAPTAAPSGLTNGFGPGPEALDVTAFWALSGTQVHEFAQPLEIVLRSTERGLVPATCDGSAWRVIHRVPTAGTLPAGWVDGFFTASDGVHVLTKHLSLFALLHDLQAPQAPQNVRGYVGPDGLTIRWLPGSDNSGTYDFVTLFAGSSDTGHYDPDSTAATVAGWKPGDPRIFRLQETDLAGNQSELTAPLAQLPSLVGMTLDQVEAALAARGLSVGTVTVGGAGKPGTVTGPEGLALAPRGAAIDVTVAPGGASTSLAFKVVTAPTFKPAKRKTMAARVLVTRSAQVSAQLISPRRVRLFTWHFKVRAGRTIVRLRIPRQVRRPGIYTLRWSARAGRETVTRTVRFRIVGARPPVQKPEIVLAGTAAKGVNGSLGKQKPTVVTSVEPTFDAAANRNRDVRVIVVDVDELGVATVHDLHVVFPSVKIVALAAGPKTMAAALRAGATIVLPRSTPPATVAKIIKRLEKRR